MGGRRGRRYPALVELLTVRIVPDQGRTRCFSPHHNQPPERSFGPGVPARRMRIVTGLHLRKSAARGRSSMRSRLLTENDGQKTFALVLETGDEVISCLQEF